MKKREKLPIYNSDYRSLYANVSRRSFLKGALAVGGALTLAGCNNDPVIKTVTITDKQTVTVTENNTVVETGSMEIPAKLGPELNMITYPSYILPNFHLCTSCHKCMIACSMYHFNEPDMYKSNIQVYTINVGGGIVDVPILCLKCRDTPCKEACPDKIAAISVDEVTGAVKVDNEKCTACGLCVDACKENRTGCLRLAKDNSGVVGMCDLCDGNPQCVMACPENALQLGGSVRVDAKHWAQGPEVIAESIGKLLYSV